MTSETQPRNARQLGIVGLGRMGGNLAAQALEKGLDVVGHDPHAAPHELRHAGLRLADKLSALCEALEPPRLVLLYVPAGPVVDKVLDEVAQQLEPGDVLADGGNSYWRDSQARARRLAAKGVAFLDVGTSGGLDGARHGACFMAGGESQAVAAAEPLLRTLAVPDGFVHAGRSGAGHLAKLVHNGIEFGMLQALGEGLALLEAYQGEIPLDISQVLRSWRHGSVIRSWLVDLLHAAYEAHGDKLGEIPSYVEDTGEVNRLVSDALELEQPIPVISQSVMQLFTSRDEQRNWARAIALMRHAFGGHPYGADPRIRDERHSGRVNVPEYSSASPS